MISARKYNFIFIIQIVLVLGVLLGGGYLVYQNVNEKNNKEENVIEEDVVVPDIKEIDQELVDIDINENIVYDGYDVTIRIPKVVDPNGEEINNKIKSDIAKYYQDKNTSIDYNYYINNDIVSIIINTIDQYEEENFLVYNFNKNDFNLLDNSQLLELKEIKEEDFHGLLINIYESHLKDILKEDNSETNIEDNKEEEKKEEKKEETKDIDRTTDYYKKTIDKENCGIDRPMFLNHENHLIVVFDEYNIDSQTKYYYNLNTKKVVER